MSYISKDEEKLMQEAFINSASRFGWFNTMARIDCFCNQGKYNAISRDYDARKNLLNIGPDRIQSFILSAGAGENAIMLDTINLHFREFLLNYLTEMHMNNEVLKQDIDIIHGISINTINKYGLNQAKVAMMNYLQDGNMNGFEHDSALVELLDQNIEKHFQFRNRAVGHDVDRSDVLFYMLLELNNKKDSGGHWYLQYSYLQEYQSKGADKVIEVYMDELYKDYENNYGIKR